jgi:WD40 repeat protein
MLRLLLITLLIQAAPTLAAAPAGTDMDTLKAMRVLRDECLGCHKPGKAKGGLLLTTREKMILGGDSGASVIPGKPAESFLYEVVLEEGDPHMPPKKQLSKDQVTALNNWITKGAVWDASVFDELPTPQPVALAPLPVTYQPVLALAISPDEKTLAIAAGSRVHLHDLTQPDRPRLGSLSGHEEAIQSLAWTPDGKTLITGGFRQLKLWDIATFKTTSQIADGFVGNLTALALTTDGKTLFAADGLTGGAGFIHRIDLAGKKLLSTWKAHDDTLYSLRLSPDGTSLASAAADKLARLWKVADSKLISTYEGHTSHVLSVAFNKDATQLATAGADREIKVWDVKSREQDVTLGDKKTAFTAIAWTPDGKALVAVTEKGNGSIYTDLKKHDGAQRSETAKQTKLAGIANMLYSVAVTSDAKTVFAGGDAGKVWIWDAAGKQTSAIEP